MLVGDLNDLLFVTHLEMFANSLPLALVIHFVALGAGVIFPFYGKQRPWTLGSSGTGWKPHSFILSTLSSFWFI